MTDERRDWTVKELSEYDGADEAYIKRLLLRGVLHGHKRGRMWLIDHDEALVRWLRRARRRTKKK